MAKAISNKQINFHWQGRNRGGKVIKGEMSAASEAALRLNLRRQGITVTKAKKLGKKSEGGKITPKDVSLFTRQLSTMLKSGVPLIQAFDITAKGTPNKSLAGILQSIKRDVESGSPMAGSFRKFPLIFDQLYCDLVEAGEQGGILDELLERLATYQESNIALMSKIKSAMFYPVAVIVIAAIVTSVIMIFVIPQFTEIFSSFGADLPGPTLVVIAISDYLLAYWWIIFPAIIGSVYAFFYIWKRSEAMQVFMDRLMLKLPVFGDLVNKSSLARWSRTLATMFSAGVPLVEALDSVGGASGNVVYREASKEIKKSISAGSSLSASMSEVGVFPSMVVQMISIGEETGQLDEMSSKIADYFDNEVNDAVKALLSLMEPIILVVLGTLIGGIVIAMYLPIFKLGAAI